MPAWNEYKEIAQSRGALAFELFVVRSTPVAAPETLKDVLPRHLEYIKKMEGEGRIFLAGPMSDDSGTLMEGHGMLVYRADTMEQARQLAENDPMHQEGCRTFELRKWLVNEGSLSFTATLSDQRVVPK